MPEAALLVPEPDRLPGDEIPRPGAALHAVPAPAPVAPRLDVPAYDLRAALELERGLGVSHVLAQVLVRRGIVELETARAFLDPKEAHDPTAFAPQGK